MKYVWDSDMGTGRAPTKLFVSEKFNFYVSHRNLNDVETYAKKCENIFAHYGNVINERNLQYIAFFRPQIAIFKMVRHVSVQCIVSYL